MNAANDEQEQRLQELTAPLRSLPHFEFAFAYGSRVFRQRNASSKDSMVDYIIGVSSPASWHSENIEMNPQHYSSWLACFGGQAIADAANMAGVGVHFNPFVQWQDKVIKYGVIGIPELLDDIQSWKRLYISGRLQKPVLSLVDESGVFKANEDNLHAALSTAILLLPPEFSEEQLYETICGLSYTGDVRLLFAEDKNKVSNIVQGNFLNFRCLYSGPIHQAASSGVLKVHMGEGPSPSRFSQAPFPESVPTLVHRLPWTLLQRIAAKSGVEAQRDTIADALVKRGSGRVRLVKQALGSIVRTSSMKQALSGVVAAGGINAFRYAASKISKAWNSSK